MMLISVPSKLTLCSIHNGQVSPLYIKQLLQHKTSQLCKESARYISNRHITGSY